MGASSGGAETALNGVDARDGRPLFSGATETSGLDSPRCFDAHARCSGARSTSVSVVKESLKKINLCTEIEKCGGCCCYPFGIAWPR